LWEWFESVFPTLPWMDQMGYTVILTMLLIIAVSLLQNKGENDSKYCTKKELFKTSSFLIYVHLHNDVLLVLFMLFLK
jgi:SSS family solute:Na+ symporter